MIYCKPVLCVCVCVFKIFHYYFTELHQAGDAEAVTGPVLPPPGNFYVMLKCYVDGWSEIVRQIFFHFLKALKTLFLHFNVKT